MEYRTLAVALTDDELKQKGDILVCRIQERDDVEQARKAAADGFKEHLKEIGGDISSLARQVRTRQEERVVTCMWERDDSRYAMILVRQDTGELVETRPMTDEERQRELFPAAATATVAAEGEPQE
jgi:hypothetical protein